MDKRIEHLNTFGFFRDTLPLETSHINRITSVVMDQDWPSLDSIFKSFTENGGVLYNYLSQFRNFESIEFIISLRDSKDEWEEDGIWHDDGSRIMAFSLSLTHDSKNIEGGVLEIRKKGDDTSHQIAPFEFGQIIVFNTGVQNYEHKINKVIKGQRLIIAGWCS